MDIRKFNCSLLGKWIWRLKLEKRGLWKDILDSKYGGWRDLKVNSFRNKDPLRWRDLKRIWRLKEWKRI